MENKEFYKCKDYNLYEKCKKCDSFGRTLDNTINTEKCYTINEKDNWNKIFTIENMGDFTRG